MNIIETSNISPTHDSMKRSDGSLWKLYNFRGGQLVLTSRGQELLSHNLNLRRHIQSYKSESRAAQRYGTERIFFRPGGNSEIFKLGETDLLIKEATKNTRSSLWQALDRMDYLYTLCLQNLYPYIRVPEHYGLLIPNEGINDYMLMRKINNGITVMDLIRGRVNVSPDIVSSIKSDFASLKHRIMEASKKTPMFKKYKYPFILSDWKEDNVLADLHTVNKDRPYTLWVIDQ